MKTRKKAKESNQPKMTLAQHYAAGAPSFWNFVKDARFSIPCLLVAIILSYVLCLNLIGNGANGYIDQMYENLTATVKNSLLNKETLEIEEEDMEEFRPTYDATLIRQNVSTYSMKYENGQHKMVCVKENGFFKAQITAILTEDFFLVAEPTRNFVSAESYNIYFWIIFGLSILGAALVIWAVSEGAFYGLLRLAIVGSCKKHGSTQLTEVTAPERCDETQQGSSAQQASA